MATMIVCVKHLFNIPDIFLILAFKNNLKKLARFERFSFFRKIWGGVICCHWEKLCCHGNHEIMCLQSFENQSILN